MILDPDVVFDLQMNVGAAVSILEQVYENDQPPLDVERMHEHLEIVVDLLERHGDE